jgi:hypothetical protein
MVDWRGPHERRNWGKNRNTSILYLAVGSTAKQRQRKFRYCGITASDLSSRSRQHAKLGLISHCEIWEGWFTFPNPHLPPRKDLELAEWIVIYYWGDLLNERKVSRAPRVSGVVISRWCNGEGQSCKKPAVFKKLPDVIAWNSKTKRWQTGNFEPSYSDDYWKKKKRIRSTRPELQ